MQTIRVGFLSAKNYLDKNAFSGTLYSMYQSLNREGIHLINLGWPSKPGLNPQKIIKKIQHLPLFLNSRYSKDLENYYKQFSQTVRQQLRRNPCDVIFAPVSSQELEFLDTDVPIIYWSDATAKALKDTYWKHVQLNLFSNEQEFLKVSGRESSAIARSEKLVFSSQWAANSAIHEYHADPSKITVFPLGANIDQIPELNNIVEKCNPSDATCRLLFIGKNWQRKGGDIAFQTLISLQSLGVKSELTVIGCQPPEEIKHQSLTVFPFIDKNIPEQRQKFREILLSSHFLIFPTQADCSPIVICEANAYGIPVLTTDVGGIPDIIQDGINGFMFSRSATGSEYATLVADVFRNFNTYKDLVLSSRAEYDQRLNWSHWAKCLHGVIQNTLCDSNRA